VPSESDKTWEQYGAADPYYGVLSDPKFRSNQLTTSAKSEFFRTGTGHINHVLDEVRQRIAPGFEPHRALDFGCGVGRLVLPLSEVCAEVVGVDISPSMLVEARRNAEEYAVTNATFVASDDRLSQVSGTFDLVHSYIVFQHIPIDRGLALLTRILDLLAPGGVGTLHFTYATTLPRRTRLLRQIRRRIPLIHRALLALRGHPKSSPIMQMNLYPLNTVTRLLHERVGASDVTFEFTNHGPFLGAIIYFQKPSAGAATSDAPIGP
jgi:SAM-dependent methyltransferase